MYRTVFYLQGGHSILPKHGLALEELGIVSKGTSCYESLCACIIACGHPVDLVLGEIASCIDGELDCLSDLLKVATIRLITTHHLLPAVGLSTTVRLLRITFTSVRHKIFLFLLLLSN